MRITKRGVGIVGALSLVGLVGLKSCDAPHPDIAVAFNKHGAGAAARHMNVDNAKTMAMEKCATIGYRGGDHGCKIKHVFEGTSQFCVSYGLNSRRVQPVIVQQSITYSGNAALDNCRETPNSVCRPGDFALICNN